MKYIVITGAASGLGLSLVQQALELGYVVFGTYRKTAPDASLIQKYPDRFVPLNIDVTKEATIVQAVAVIKEKLNGQGLFALINNAAFIKAHPLMMCETKDLAAHFNTNVIGVFSMIKHLLPLLKAYKPGGRIVNINSVAGQLHLPFQGAYAVSKSALTMLTNMIRLELVEDSNLQLTDIWLGMLQTDVHRRNAENAADVSHTEYASWAEKMKKRVSENYAKGFPTAEIATQLFKLLDKKRMRYTYLISQSNWKVRILFLLGNRPLVYRLIRQAYFGKT